MIQRANEAAGTAKKSIYLSRSTRLFRNFRMVIPLGPLENSF